jgi:hypothetical protein
MEPLLLILKRLIDQNVELALVGGLAAITHGAEIVTQDVDVCIPFTEENMARIVAAIRDIRPRFRFRPDRMPMWDDPARLATLKNLNIVTDLGVIDFLGEISGVGDFTQVRARSQLTTLAEGISCLTIGLDALIDAKRATGRPKDVRVAQELEVVRKALGDSGPPKTPGSSPHPNPHA